MAASPDGTHPYDMGEGVSETRDDRNEKNYEEQDEKYPDVPSPDDMEEGVSETKDDKNENFNEEKMQNSQISVLLVIWRKVMNKMTILKDLMR